MKPSVLVRGACAALLVSAGLAGCANYGGAAGQQLFDATLSGAQEVPPATTAGSGQANVRYNPATTMLSWSVTHTGLSGPVTAAHIHGPAGPGQNAGVVIPFTNVGAATIAGEARLTPEQLGQLTSGQWYVNLHTAANPGGEIRGQLRPNR
ncbi:MAG TPA: CHRD domain-containing protein [Ramlibacter sp.]|nr:CHRD domain-containing protein [Ramlibacter sp.]